MAQDAANCTFMWLWAWDVKPSGPCADKTRLLQEPLQSVPMKNGTAGPMQPNKAWHQEQQGMSPRGFHGEDTIWPQQNTVSASLFHWNNCLNSACFTSYYPALAEARTGSSCSKMHWFPIIMQKLTEKFHGLQPMQTFSLIFFEDPKRENASRGAKMKMTAELCFLWTSQEGICPQFLQVAPFLSSGPASSFSSTLSSGSSSQLLLLLCFHLHITFCSSLSQGPQTCIIQDNLPTQDTQTHLQGYLFCQVVCNTVTGFQEWWLSLSAYHQGFTSTCVAAT